MKRKNILVLTLMISALLIVPTIVISIEEENLDVSKKVWNGINWVESITAEIGDVVSFNITIIYTPVCGYMATNINVTDNLPSCLSYDVGSAVIKHGDTTTYYGDSGTSGQLIFWNLTDTFGIKLYAEGSNPYLPPHFVYITFNATVTASTDEFGEDNVVFVNALEHCCEQPLYGEDDATVIVEEPTKCVDIIKEVKNGINWDDEVTVNVDDDVDFKLTIVNCGEVNLTGVFVVDNLPSFLTYNNDAVPSPSSSSAHHIEWTLGTLTVGSSQVITFSAHAITVGEGDNIAGVTTCQGVNDEDDAHIIVEEGAPDIEIIKKVKDHGDWVDSTTVYVCENVEFKLIVTNTGVTNLSGVLVTDDLPSFLTFNNDANITPSTFSNHHIEWNLGTLTVGSSKEITFSAHAITVGEGDNIAGVTTCQGVNDEDDAHVIVAGMIIEKEVWDPNLHAWMEEIDASVGDTVKFRITIYHYGNGTYNLYNIRVRDELPECLEYANNANPTETDISTDGKTIWWNLSITVDAGESTAITFYALITETSGCGPCINLANVTASECSGKTFYWEDTATVNAECPVIADAGGPYFDEIDEPINLVGSVTGGVSPYTYAWDLDDDGYYDDATGQSVTRSWSSQGTYVISLKVTDDDDRWDTDDTTVTIAPPDNDPPNKPSKPSGTTSGDTGTSYTYSTSATDPDGDIVKYGWDWDGNGAVDEWTGFYSSGTTVSKSHSWTAAGTYNVEVKAEDEYGSQSGFSTALTVVISGNDPPNKPTITGPTSGKAGESYTYSAYATDPDGDQVYYWFDWDDGTNSGWTGPYNSGQTASASHVWAAQGTYQVKVKSKDINDAESVWSNPLPITMPKNKAINPLFLRFLEEHPHIFPMLRYILEILGIY